MTPEGRSRAGRGGESVGAAGNELVQLIVQYAKQETIGPVKGLARFVVFGVSGSIMLSVGGTVLLLALLRALQTETGDTFKGNLSWVPYLVTAAVAASVAALAGWRVTKGVAVRPTRRQDADARG